MVGSFRKNGLEWWVVWLVVVWFGLVLVWWKGLVVVWRLVVRFWKGFWSRSWWVVGVWLQGGVVPLACLV